jgi:ferric-dicitrate binding protein FerR (iron transport regulator)
MKTLSMNLSNNIERKIHDYFNGQLPPVEEAELIHWLNSDESNKAFFFNMKERLDPQKMQHPLLETSFIELKNKLIIAQGFNSNQLSRKRILKFSFLRVAAMLAIALIAGFSIAYLFIEPQTSKTEVVWFEMLVPPGEKSQLRLPDGSKVWVNSESKISYPSNFMDGDREIKLTGEAYFEVAKSEGKPFTVKTNDYNVRVLGTKFNVMAYPDFGRTETSLIEGKIEIQKGEQSIPVVPGEIFTYSDNQFTINEKNTIQSALWKDDVFDFERITFKELVVRLERWYDVEIEIKYAELNSIVYSGIFKNEETIWQVLNTFQLTLPIQYKRVDSRKFVIEKKK